MKNGFTIIELVISIFILSVAVVGVFSAFSMVNILTSDMTDRLTATYLAQEGIEIVRNIRDTNWLNMDDAGCNSNLDAPDCPVSWVDGLTLEGISNSVDCNTVAGCGADYRSTQMDPSLAGAYLYADNNSGFYIYNAVSSLPSKFKRKIVLAPVEDVDGNSDHIIKVAVQVSWDKRATVLSGAISASSCTVNNCITVETTLYDWYNYAHH